MEFEINKFLDSLHSQHLAGEAAAALIYEEIKKAENMKIGLMDDVASEPDYVAAVCGQIDTYIFQLQELEKELNPGNLPPDQQAALQDTEVRRRIGIFIGKLKKLDQDKQTGK
jgi:hypothetical protein